ncbi:Fanconi anemia group B protein [Bombina bombina]|uniref:Fanconi anemia group B protein n=1 Tax=Bombina bombina TaxID=8345 RepID=UPI00235AC30D|nr:Fanconi anemia group B protein [Bombina bombina]
MAMSQANQIAATWHHVRSILVDDFIGTGSDQLLLLFNNIPDMSADQQRFQITDCGEINYPSNLYNEKEGSSAEEGYHENRFRIIQALETRLQAGLRSVQEMQQHLQVKERVLKSSCETLFDMLQGKETILHCAEEEGLVSLWDDSLHISCPSESEATSLSTDSECFVEKIWHRVVDNFFVIGVKLYPSIYLSLSNVALSLLMDEEITSLSPVTKCQTNVLNMAIRSLFDYNASYQTEPVAKKQRLDSHNKDNLSRDSKERPCSSSYQNDLEHTVTAVTELSPLLALNNTSCVLLLHARRENQPDSILKREKLTVPCGRISLRLEEVLKGNHTVNVFEHCQGDVNLENVLALLSAYEKRSFRIWSPDYTLVSVKAWLLGPMQGKPIKQLPDLFFSCLPGSLHGTLFIWIPGTPCEGTLTIFYRTEPGLLQCLYSLKCVLPPTCVVNTISVGGKYCLTESLAQSMEEELLALRGSASAAASDVEKEMKQRCIMKTKTSNTIGPLSDTKERVQKYREELQIEQKQSKLGVPLTTSCNMYRHIAFNVAEIQMKTDTIAFKLAQS